MRISEKCSEGDKLIEAGEQVKARIEEMTSSVKSAQRKVAEAQRNLDMASRTDENGETVGDVEGARAELEAAIMDLEYLEEELRAEQRELDKITEQKKETLKTLDEYSRVEEKNISILQQLQAKSFGDNVGVAASAIISQMNLAEATKVALYQSMGMSYTAKSAGASSSAAGGAFSPDTATKQEIEEQQKKADHAALSYNKGRDPAGLAQRKGVVGAKRTKNHGVSFADTDRVYVHEGKKCIVKIKATGNRDKDFLEANRMMFQSDRTPTGYVWHHVDDYNVEDNTLTMELVRKDAHAASIAHAGACSQYDAVHGPHYNRK